MKNSKDAMIERLYSEKAKKSTGYAGKLWDAMFRACEYSDKTKIDWRCRTAGRADARIDGKTYEIKTGSGEVAKDYWEEEFSDDAALVGIHFVAFAPFALEVIQDAGGIENITEDDILDNTWIFTRNEFIAMLHQCHKNPWNYHRSTGKVNIQTWGKCPRARLEEILYSGEYPTARDLKISRG